MFISLYVAAGLAARMQFLFYHAFAHDVISSHWAPSWLIFQITLVVYIETVVSIYYFIVSLSVQGVSMNGKGLHI